MDRSGFEWSDVCGARPAVMGIVNVTPDSFSDGGRFLAPDAAIAHGLALAAAGADVLDIGGESTRPGAEPVAAAEELARVLPVVEGLVAELGAEGESDVAISIDTTKAPVAAAALAAGARIVNDVSAGRGDPELLDVVAEAGAGLVAMHMQGRPATMQDAPCYDDVVAEVVAFLRARLEVARAAGVRPEACCVDPGIGFGKTLAHNLQLLAGLPQLVAELEAPVLVGTSRKRFLGTLLRDVAGEPGEPVPLRRDDATLATVVWALDHGAALVRVHDVRPATRAIALLEALGRAA